MSKKNYVLIFTFFSIWFAQSCKLPFDEVDMNVKLTPEYAVPLVETEMTIQDLFENFDGYSYLQVQSDGTLRMFYNGKTVENQPFNLFSALPEVQTIQIVQSDMAIPFPSPSNSRIDAIDFKNGFLKWQFEAQATPLTVRITVPQLTKNGQVFDKTFTLSNTTYRDSISLLDWHCEPTLGNIVFSCQAKKSTGESVSLNNQGRYELTRFEAKYMKGYFGQFLVALPRDTVSLDFFKNWKPNGKINFTDPKIYVTFDNGLGFPIQARTAVAESVNLKGQKLALDNPLGNGLNLAYPSINEVGGNRRTTLTIDKKNSNIVDVLNSNPTHFIQSIIGITNLDNPNKTAGFLSENSRFKVTFGVEVPLFGTAEDFVVYDTLAVDMSKFTQIAAAEFKLTTDNEMPIDMKLQGYFVNSSGAIVDSLVTTEPIVLRGAPTTALGTTIGSNPAYNFIKVDANRFNNIRSAKKIIVKYTVSSTNRGLQPVLINTAQYISMKLGVRAGINL
ncbi:MAG: hypothetical protein JNL70_18135 [Saprospiraceae bacterium]|nr:hypothetical protein [Saprospiraceae bacterium]